MFTGIVETMGIIKDLKKHHDNINFTIWSNITHKLKIDQSVSHNGICLTVVGIQNDYYQVTAIRETIEKTNVSHWKINNHINLERSTKLGDRLDGHIVQGHIDQIGVCKNSQEANGSRYFTFEYENTLKNITIEKGSITVNGVSLTVVNSKDNEFSVAIIPYTFQNTNFKDLTVGAKVNLEFDVIGKYIARLMPTHL